MISITPPPTTTPSDYTAANLNRPSHHAHNQISFDLPLAFAAEGSSKYSTKYTTLSAIEAMQRQQQVQGSIRSLALPTILDSRQHDHHPYQHQHHQQQQQQGQYPISASSSPAAVSLNVAAHIKPLLSTSAITAAVQEMDKNHGTVFHSWIHNPANLDYISLRLRPLCLEYPLVEVANVLRWVGADWSSTDCKALFRAVTQSWSQSRRKVLAFLLIRDEEMRTKAKAKLIEFAKKMEAKQQQYQQQQQQQQQSINVGAAAAEVLTNSTNNNNNNSTRTASLKAPTAATATAAASIGFSPYPQRRVRHQLHHQAQQHQHLPVLPRNASLVPLSPVASVPMERKQSFCAEFL